MSAASLEGPGAECGARVRFNAWRQGPNRADPLRLASQAQFSWYAVDLLALSRESIERLDLGEPSLMDFGDPYGDRRSGVVHINMPNIGVDSRKQILGKLACPGIEPKD